MTIFAAASTILLILDPFGNLVVFNAILNRLPAPRRRVVLIREMLIAYGLLLGFLLAGGPLLRFLGLDQSSLSIAGGILLFLIAIGMVFPKHGMMTGGDEIDDEPFIVPLATPMMAGPSVIAFLLLLASKEPERLGAWVGALTMASAVSAAILLAGGYVAGLLGPRGMRAVEKLMGMLLILVAVQMMLNGLGLYWTEHRAA